MKSGMPTKLCNLDNANEIPNKKQTRKDFKA
jgi:hypothetical protein